MKIGVFITARLGSTRLQQKHLLKVSGREIMKYLVDRINNEFDREITEGEAIVAIVTGNQSVNSKFGELFKECRVFYGDDDNIPPVILPPIEPKPPVTTPAKKHFYGTISLDPIKAKMDFATIVDEVVEQFTSKLGVDVKISVEIQATSHRDGFDEAMQRAVKENCKVLKFGNSEFEGD